MPTFSTLGRIESNRIRRFIVFRQLSAGFTSNSEAKAHGSILMVSAILKHGGYFMMPRFDETCVAVMGLKDKHGQ